MLRIKAAGGRHEELAAVHVKRRAHREGGVPAVSKHVLVFLIYFNHLLPEDRYYMVIRKHHTFNQALSILL